MRLKSTAIAAAPLALTLLSGCSSLPPVGQSARASEIHSPVAAEVVEASRHPGPYPTFASIPKPPRDVRPLGAWRRDIASAKADRERVQAEAASIPQTLAGSDDWAAAARAQAQAPAPAETSSTEEFLAEMQARAKAPKPPK